MRLSPSVATIAIFAVALVLSAATAAVAVRVVERESEAGVRAVLDRAGIDWAEVDAYGLQVFLLGTAPSEAARFRALSAAGEVVDAARLIDDVNVAEADRPAPPRFSVEILRRDGGLTLIGLVPAATDRAALRARAERAAGGAPVSDLLETADHPAPEGWRPALEAAFDALERLPRAKISIEAGRVTVKGAAESDAERRRLEAAIARDTPEAVRLALRISAPRPVIAPFTLRFVKDAAGARFDACAAATEAGRARILEAAAAAGLTGKADCRLGLGAPGPDWAEAASAALGALDRMGGGTLTMTDTEVALVAPRGTDAGRYEGVVQELGDALPDRYRLDATLPAPREAETDATAPEFIATLSPEGAVQLRGPLASETARVVADSLARARFGSEVVHTAAELREGLPEGWQTRVLAGIEGLAELARGALVVTPDAIELRGETGDTEATAEITALMAEKLGGTDGLTLEVTYREALDPEASKPTPEECIASIRGLLEERKITFEPGSATLDGEARRLMDDIAEVLRDCGSIPLEIAGHTDSQGRESMNLELSEARAQAVLDELRNRRVLTADFRARGYGESRPIADNGTEAGREANRRIEFSLIRPEDAEDTEGTEETADDDGDAG
ncbi:OmpA family protein [Rhodosalinus sediminis]|uniref:OmpA family protein n=1 Tax=Rhodosalinus sediminis TaxID=1940533 RepID=UPI0023526EB7|nr:OmpA family protein [Rhodosalinus sediminis]